MDEIPLVPKWRGNKNKIPVSASLPKREEDIESESFLISYQCYNDNECEIKRLAKNRARKALENLRIIGNCTFSTLYSNGIKVTQVKEEGDYKKLFKTVPQGYKLFEHNIQSTARMFYFIVGTIFHLVAITNSHLEIGKQRK